MGMWVGRPAARVRLYRPGLGKTGQGSLGVAAASGGEETRLRQLDRGHRPEPPSPRSMCQQHVTEHVEAKGLLRNRLAGDQQGASLIAD